MVRLLIASFVLLSAAGCSTLGINISPPHNRLTEQVEAVLSQSPRRAVLSRELDMSVLVSHYLQPGDVLLIEPVKLDSEIRFPADQKVLADGTIDLSGFGRLVVSGMTLESAENQIERMIVDAGQKATQINVRLLEPVHRIYVLGEVASPGSYPFIGNETVLDGILAAGGLTTQANPCKVILARPTPPPSCRVALPICYREITQLGDTTTNYQLQPGDRIFVGARSFYEDLQFWNTNKTCERCCGCQSACPDPTIANFTNPISSTLPIGPPPPSMEWFMHEGKSSESTIDSDQKTDRPADFPTDAGNVLPLPAMPRNPRLDSSSKPAPSQEASGQLEFDPPLQ